MKRLAFHIYLTVVGVLLLFAVLASVTWLVHPKTPWERGIEAELGATASELLPGPDRPVEDLQVALARMAERFHVAAAVYDSEGRRLAFAGEPLPESPPRQRRWIRHESRSVTVTLPLPDGRLLVVQRTRPPGGGAMAFLVFLLLLAVAVAIGAWPLVRRLTRRLERLRQRVEDLGRGDLKARAPVEGRDEVAHLASSFNRAADRIEELVEAQRRVLMHASHELRSPLARLRVSLEMMQGSKEQREQAEQDLAELDGLIDEVLEASRLQTQGPSMRREPLDLLGLVAEEGARHGIDVRGQPLVVTGDARLLRRLVRNLLENARRHGGDGPVEARVEAGEPTGVRLRVSDRGPGVAEDERDLIFEPFHRPAGSAETGEGFGLGLALVRQIARAHGGDARCRPRDGGGTVFEILLRRDVQPATSD